MDEPFLALANRQRRLLLLEIAESNPASTEPRFPDSDPSGQKITTSRTKMHHTHLPKLKELGYIQSGDDEDTVVKGPNFEEIQPFLEMLIEHSEALPDEFQPE